VSPHDLKHSLIRLILLDLHARKVMSRWCFTHAALSTLCGGARRRQNNHGMDGSVGFTMLKQNFFVSCMPIPASALGSPSAPSTRTLGDLLHALKQSVLPTSTCSNLFRYLFAAATHSSHRQECNAFEHVQSVGDRRVSWTLTLTSTSTSAPLFPSSSGPHLSFESFLDSLQHCSVASTCAHGIAE
jgi:hypothetical protein